MEKNLSTCSKEHINEKERMWTLRITYTIGGNNNAPIAITGFEAVQSVI